MSDELNSQLSAFVDDELTPEESELFVRRLCRDENLRRTAACYGLIGDAIRGETAVTAPGNFVAGVMMAVAGQMTPAVQAQPAQAGHSMRNWGIGLAASVVLAAVAMMTLPGRGPDGLDTVIANNDAVRNSLNSAAAVSDSGVTTPVFMTGAGTESVSPAGIDPAVVASIGVNAQNVPIVMPISAERRAQLNNLLLQHLNSAGTSRQPGLVSFRNVGFVTQTESQR